MVGINPGTIISRLSFVSQDDLVMQLPSGTRLLASSRKVVLSFHLRRDRQLVSILINTNLNNWNVRSPGRRQHEKTSKTQEERGTLANAPTGCRVSIRSFAALASFDIVGHRQCQRRDHAGHYPIGTSRTERGHRPLFAQS